jgi:hypothetical protein
MLKNLDLTPFLLCQTPQRFPPSTLNHLSRRRPHGGGTTLNCSGYWLMELELVEPSLYLRMDKGAPERFARALHDRILSENEMSKV